MKAKGLLVAVLLAATNFAWAQGGLSIDNVEKYMGPNDHKSANDSQPEIDVQGATDKFDVVTPNRDRALTDTGYEDDPYYELDLLG